MSELVGVRRSKPSISYANSIVLTTNDIIFPTLPMIINRYRNHKVVVRSIYESPSYRTMIGNKSLVYERIHTPDLIEEHSYEYNTSTEIPIRYYKQSSNENSGSIFE